MVSAGGQVERTTKSNVKANSNGNWKPNLNRQLRNTRLCAYFQQTGTCKHGARCGFAHEEADLQKPPDLRQTRMCPNENCQVADCPFAHKGDELKFTDFYHKTSLCMWYAVGKCRNGTSCRFAHGEDQLRCIPGSEGDKPQQSKNGKADKAEKKAQNTANKKENKQAMTEKPVEPQKSENKAKGNKSKKTSQEAAAVPKVDKSPQLSAPQGASEAGKFVAPQQRAQPQPKPAVSKGVEPTKGTPIEPMFIQPLQVESSVFPQPPSSFTALPQPFQRPGAVPIPAMDRVDYNGLSQLLSGYHCNNIAPMVEAQQQAALGQLGQIPALTKPKSTSTYAGLNLDPAFSGNHPAPPGFGQNALPNSSTSWEIRALAEHIKTLGEQVSKLQQCISQTPANAPSMKVGHVSETTKSGSGSFVGLSSSQGSGSSGDDISPPGSPLPAQGRNGHPDALHAEAARLSFALQRIAAAQGANLMR